jgi:hypothetical protein
MFALEVRDSVSPARSTGRPLQSDVVAIEVHVRDTKRYKDTNGSAFFGFGGGISAPPASAPAVPADAGCIACHKPNGAVDSTFVQFYPTALAVAEAKGTLRADYVPPPPSPASSADPAEKGWTEAEGLAAALRGTPPPRSCRNGRSTALATGCSARRTTQAIALFDA